MQKNLSTLKFLASVLLLLFCTVWAEGNNPLEDLENRKKCDRVLMQSFKLEGMKFPHKPQKISICPMIDENCCTVMDELTILKYWKEFSMEKWKKFSSYIIYLVGNIINFQPYVRRMGIHNVPFFFSKISTFEYMSYTCSVLEESSHTVEFKVIRKKLTKRMRNLKLTMLRDLFNNDSKKLNRFLKEEKKREKMHLKKQEETATIMIDGFTENQRRRLLKKMTKSEKQAYINANSIQLKSDESKNKAHYRFLRDVRVMSKAIERKLSRAFMKLKNKAAMALDDYEHFLDKTKLNFKPILQKYQTDVEKFIDKGKFYIEQLEQMVNYDFKSYHRFMNSVKAHMVDNLHAAYEVMEKGGGKTHPAFMIKLLNKIEKKHLPGVLIPKLPDLTLPDIEVSPLTIPKLQCYTRMIPQKRNLLVINLPKLEYCSNALDRITRLKMSEYAQYLNLMKGELLRLISVKKGLYCVLCDVNLQAFVDKKQNMLLLDRKFCGNYIGDFRTYFEFMNVRFVEYLDSIFQYINCVQSDGDELDFPFFTIIEKKKRMIQVWNLCFDSLGTEDEFKNCYFICSEFKYDRNTPTIEGDVEFLKTVYFEIMSFMRKNKMQMIKTIGRAHRKINWKMQESMLVQKNKHFDHQKDQKKLSTWHMRDAEKEVKSWEDGRILEALDDSSGNSWSSDPGNRRECVNDSYEYDRMLYDNPNIYQDHSIFFKPSKVQFRKSKIPKRVGKPGRVLESDRDLWINPKPLIQGTRPYIDEVKDSVDLDKLKEEFHEEQRLKQLAKEEATPVEREVKKDEIYERIDMTVDMSLMELVYLKEDDGINPLRVSEGSEFDIDQKKLIQVNLNTFKMEVIHRDVIKPVVTLTNRKIENFNKDIDMKVMNTKNLPHKFKSVTEGDWYGFEKDKLEDKKKGLEEPKEDDIDKSLHGFENLKIDLSKPDPVTVDDEMNKKMEKNMRVKSLWEQVRNLGL